MFNIFGLILIFILGIPLYWLSVIFQRKVVPRKLKAIPGNDGLPFFGDILNGRKSLYKYLTKQGKKFNGIFYFKMGRREIIILNNYEVLQKALKDNGNVFSGRWQNILVKHIVHDSGILFKDKEWWATQRSFLLRILRDFGFGKQRSYEIVNDECHNLLEELKEKSGQITSCRLLFPQYMVNIIAKLGMNIRFDKTDPNFQDLTRTIEFVAQNTNFFVQILLMYPILEKWTTISKILLWISGRDKEMGKIHDYIKTIIEDHKKRFVPENEGIDVIDMFLLEQHKLKINDVSFHTFTEWQLIRVVTELFIAGYETTSTTMSWAMLLLANRRDIQDKLYKEIIQVIGPEKLATMNDKKNMPYTQAVMDEIFRLSSVVPLSLPHRVLDDCEINSYYIPKNSIVFPNLYAIHRDEKQWENPHKFYPEHFLSVDEDNKITYKPRNDLVPFSIGKRQCLGEALARMEFFIFLTAIIQRFNLSLPNNVNREVFSKMIFGTDGTIRAPLGSDVIFTSRV